MTQFLSKNVKSGRIIASSGASVAHLLIVRGVTLNAMERFADIRLPLSDAMHRM
jgi:hypothetical protein